MGFFGRMQGSFSVSPSEYHRAYRNKVGAGKAFLGPWNYAGASPGSSVKQKFSSPQEQPKIATTPRKQYASPQEQPRNASKPRRGFVSPIEKGLVVTKTYNYGANRTKALSEE